MELVAFSPPQHLWQFAPPPKLLVLRQPLFSQESFQPATSLTEQQREQQGLQVQPPPEMRRPQGVRGQPSLVKRGQEAERPAGQAKRPVRVALPALATGQPQPRGLELVALERPLVGPEVEPAGLAGADPVVLERPSEGGPEAGGPVSIAASGRFGSVPHSHLLYTNLAGKNLYFLTTPRIRRRLDQRKNGA